MIIDYGDHFNILVACVERLLDGTVEHVKAGEIMMTAGNSGL